MSTKSAIFIDPVTCEVKEIPLASAEKMMGDRQILRGPLSSMPLAGDHFLFFGAYGLLTSNKFYWSRKIGQYFGGIGIVLQAGVLSPKKGVENGMLTAIMQDIVFLGHREQAVVVLDELMFPQQEAPF